MFGLSFGELVIIAVILIIVVGPERLPEVMRSLGKTMRSIQKANRDLQTSIGIDEFRRELLRPMIDAEAERKKQRLYRPPAIKEPPAANAEPAPASETARDDKTTGSGGGEAMG